MRVGGQGVASRNDAGGRWPGRRGGGTGRRRPGAAAVGDGRAVGRDKGVLRWEEAGKADGARTCCDGGGGGRGEDMLR